MGYKKVSKKVEGNFYSTKNLLKWKYDLGIRNVS